MGKGAFKDEVNGLPLAKVRGKFTIPVEVVKHSNNVEEKYVRGPGILYFVSMFPVGRYAPNWKLNLSNRLDKPTILKTLQDASKEKP